VAVAGTDDWLAWRIAGHLVGLGLTVRHLGIGSSSLHRVDTLVLVPRLVPRSANATRDVGLGPTGITLGAATQGQVDHVVLVSLVGADPKKPGHLGALGRLEAKVLACGSRVTIIRATQVYGTANDPGPFIERIHRTLSLASRLGALEIEPVFVGEVIEAVEEAVYRRLPAATFEVAGPRRVRVKTFAEQFDRHAHREPVPSSLIRLLHRSHMTHAARALGDLLEAQPVVIRRKVRLDFATNREVDALGTPRPVHDRIGVA
jgi:hypothetical protein